MASFKQILDRLYARLSAETLTQIHNSVISDFMRTRVKALEAEAKRLAEKGELLKPNNPVLRAYLNDLDRTMTMNAGRIDAASERLVLGGIDTASAQGRRLIPSWADPDPRFVRNVVNYTDLPAWGYDLQKYGDKLGEVFANQAIRGAIEHKHPLTVARRIVKLSETLPVSSANNLMRTLYLESYRTGYAVAQNENRRLLSQVIRFESLDDRICMACVSLHGQVLWRGGRDDNKPIPRMQEHHQGRGTTLVVPRGTSRSVERGEKWFRNLTEPQQRGIMRNNGAYDEWKSGKIAIKDFVQDYKDPVFGDMIRQASLKQIKGRRR